MSSGGPRPGGGRPKGSKDGPHTLRGTKARAYKELYEEEAVKVLCNLRPNAHVTASMGPRSEERGNGWHRNLLIMRAL